MERERSDHDEFGFIEWVKRQLPAAGKSVQIGPGDDCALVAPARHGALLKVDSVLEGEHFQLNDPQAPGFATPRQVGWKVMARTISDIAAMGGTPRYAMVASALPRGASAELREELLRGLLDAAAPFGVALVGGDTKSWRGPLALSVSVIGEMGAGPDGQALAPLTRAAALPGDLIGVTGELGGSILGHHLSFAPRVQEGRFLAGMGARAAIDLSDGLSGDLWQICRESACSARVEAERVPISAAAQQLATQRKTDPLDHALHDGEDFELLFTIPAERASDLLAAWPYATRLSMIGEVLPYKGYAPQRPLGDGLWIERDGQRLPLPLRGYEHEL